ncbi:hypothetical protein CHS0354_034420 [Potamilus streckersoni]|uniref:Uncharacterized protein n=1 Tax=Potamilus streckersoni TaxID=2493646 RepID=A0AAE0S9H1_9BIVA|nr:hypothetical protein CHS0354_034420 [Potamilus streckersoni]
MYNLAAGAALPGQPDYSIMKALNSGYSTQFLVSQHNSHQHHQHHQQQQHQHHQIQPTKALYFTQENIDFVLYGYTTGTGNQNGIKHALSGLKIGEISHGIDRILAQGRDASPSLMMSTWKMSRTDPPPQNLPPGLT